MEARILQIFGGVIRFLLMQFYYSYNDFCNSLSTELLHDSMFEKKILFKYIMKRYPHVGFFPNFFKATKHILVYWKFILPYLEFLNKATIKSINFNFLNWKVHIKVWKPLFRYCGKTRWYIWSVSSDKL